MTNASTIRLLAQSQNRLFCVSRT